jgi:hypothetical protein
VSTPVYACRVCGTRQPVRDVDAADPPARLGNTQCRGAYGGCHRLTTLELVPDAEWSPGEWELRCPQCGYETVAWGDRGFGPSETWDCPECAGRMHVTDVSQTTPEE